MVDATTTLKDADTVTHFRIVSGTPLPQTPTWLNFGTNQEMEQIDGND
jgi:hypothetical protein